MSTNVLEEFSKRTAGVTAVLLVLSVAYDFGYLQASGLSFQALNTTVTDHLRSAILWAPGVLVGLIVGTLFGLGSSPRQVLPGQPRTKRSFGENFFFWSYFPLIAVAAFTAPATVSIAAVGLAAGVLLMHFQPFETIIHQRVGRGITAQIFFIPVSLALVASLGAIQGHALTAANSKTIQMTVKLGTEERKFAATGIRRFSTMTLVAAPEGIMVIPSDSIVYAIHVRPDARSLACRLLGHYCPSP